MNQITISSITKNIKIQIALISIILIVSIGLSYAYFNANSTGEHTSTQLVYSGSLAMNYDGSSNILITNFVPGTTISKQFTVTNTSNRLITNYKIYFANLKNTFYMPSEANYSLTCSSSDGYGCSTSNGTIPLTSSSVLTVSINAGATQTFTLSIIFSDISNFQDYNQGKQISFQISVGEYERKLSDAIFEYYGSKDQISSETDLKSGVGQTFTMMYKYIENRHYSSTIYSSSTIDIKAVGSSFIFNELTGRFTLTNIVGNAIYSTNYTGFYTCNSSSYTNCTTMYKIIGDFDTTTDSTKIYVRSLYYYTISNTNSIESTSTDQTLSTSLNVYSSTTGNKYVGSGYYSNGTNIYLTDAVANQKYSTSVGKYTLNTSTANGAYATTKVYKILSVDTTTDATKQYIKTADVVSFTPGSPTVLANNIPRDNDNTTGVFKALDNLGTTYYYKGNITNNYLNFAGQQWRIIRINGDGSIRIALAIGISTPIVNTNSYCTSSIGDTNSNYFDCFKSGTVADGEYSNKYESTSISAYLRNWYNQNVLQDFDYLTVNSSICESQTFSNTFNSTTLSFAAITSTYTLGSYINYKCEFVNITSGTRGEIKMLNMKVGYLTAIDKLYSGNVSTTYPGYFGALNIYALGGKYSTTIAYYPNTYSLGSISTINPISNILVNPVISLNQNVLVSGFGTSNSPYVVTGLKDS